MNSVFIVSLLFVPTAVNALKLLASNYGGEEILEGDDEEWESDIQFAYKPFKGRCLKTGATLSGKTGGTSEYATGTTGKLTELLCAAATQKQADYDKYCDNAPTHADKKFATLWTSWRNYLVAEEKFKACPHIFAKLASMGNKKLTADGKATHVSGSDTINNLVLSFSFIPATCDADANDETAYAGRLRAYTADGVVCYTSAGIAWAKNDPKVRNMDGQEFEIMATGTFSMLKLETSSLRTELEVMATIDRAGTRCGATYIQNISLTGQWVEDVGVPRIQIKAAAVLPKAKALQVKFDKEWQHADSQWPYAAVQKASRRRFTLKLHEVTVMVSVDSHRIHENGVKTHRFANFLNVNFAGIGSLSNLSVRGLLGSDPHGAAETIPEGCGSTNLKSSEEGISMFSTVDIE